MQAMLMFKVHFWGSELLAIVRWPMILDRGPSRTNDTLCACPFYLFYLLTIIVSINLHFVKFLLNEHGMVWYGMSCRGAFSLCPCALDAYMYVHNA